MNMENNIKEPAPAKVDAKYLQEIKRTLTLSRDTIIELSAADSERKYSLNPETTLAILHSIVWTQKLVEGFIDDCENA